MGAVEMPTTLMRLMMSSRICHSVCGCQTMISPISSKDGARMTSKRSDDLPGPVGSSTYMPAVKVVSGALKATMKRRLSFSSRGSLPEICVYGTSPEICVYGSDSFCESAPAM
jgi:hypothetical protein